MAIKLQDYHAKNISDGGMFNPQVEDKALAWSEEQSIALNATGVFGRLLSAG